MNRRTRPGTSTAGAAAKSGCSNSSGCSTGGWASGLSRC